MSQGGAAAVRNIIDGLHRYMLEKREKEFQKMCVDTKIGIFLDEDEACACRDSGSIAGDSAADAALSIASDKTRNSAATLSTMLLEASVAARKCQLGNPV